MKRFLLVSFSLLTSFVSAQTFEWAKRAGSYAYDYGRGICADGIGNVYVTGEFEQTGNFSGITVNSYGNHDIFVAKYNPSGSIQWVRKAGGTAGDVGHAISSDRYGNVYVTGEMQGYCTFGNLTIQAGQANDIFIAKYDTYGNALWVRKAGGYDSDKGLGVADKYGNVYLTGFFQASATFGPYVLNSSGGKDIFLAKYDTNGNLLWVKKFGGTGKDEGRSVTVDNSGNVYITGFFYGTAKFGSTWLTSSGESDIFVSKFDANGNMLWVQKAGGPYFEVGRGISNDNYGNIYLTGVFSYGSWFGSQQINTIGSADVFVASYNSSGTLRWVKRAGGYYYDEATSIKSDPYGNTYITGTYGVSSAFGATTLSGADYKEVFVASLTNYGSFRWAVKGGGRPDDSYTYGEDEAGLGVTVDAANNVYATGASRSDISFGSTMLYQYYFTDIFVTKVKQSSTARVMQPELVNVKENDCEETMTLTADAFPEMELQWRLNGEVIEEGKNTEVLVTQKGTYDLIIRNGEDTAWSEPIVFDPVELKMRCEEDEKNAFVASDKEEKTIEVYPNPNHGDFVVLSKEAAEFEIVNNIGQIVQRGTIEKNDAGMARISMNSEIPRGAYVIKLKSGDKVTNTKFVLDR